MSEVPSSSGSDPNDSPCGVVVSKLNLCDVDSSSSESCADILMKRMMRMRLRVITVIIILSRETLLINFFRLWQRWLFSSHWWRWQQWLWWQSFRVESWWFILQSLQTCEYKCCKHFLICGKCAFRSKCNDTITVIGADVPESRTDAVCQLQTTGFDFNPDFNPSISIIYLSSLIHPAQSPGNTNALCRVRHLIQHVEKMPQGGIGNQKENVGLGVTNFASELHKDKWKRKWVNVHTWIQQTDQIFSTSWWMSMEDSHYNYWKNWGISSRTEMWKMLRALYPYTVRDKAVQMFIEVGLFLE